MMSPETVTVALLTQPWHLRHFGQRLNHTNELIIDCARKPWYSPSNTTCFLSHTGSKEPRSAGDVLSAPFDLCWLHHRGVMKALWVAALFSACTCASWNAFRQVLQSVPHCTENSWGRSSALTGDDITWQVFIWLISRSLAPSRAPDTCFTSEALVQETGGPDRTGSCGL